MMSDALPFKSQRLSDWQLLAEFVADHTGGTHDRLLQEMAVVLQALNMQQQQLERIQSVFSRVAKRAMLREGQGPSSRIHVRVWLLRTCTDDCGWGFFVVETTDQKTGSAATPETDQLVQLFLYQERDL
jgi:hypothetical protein